MKNYYLIFGCLCILTVLVMPALACTIKTLIISLEEQGNAQVDREYDVSFFE